VDVTGRFTGPHGEETATMNFAAQYGHGQAQIDSEAMVYDPIHVRGPNPSAASRRSLSVRQPVQPAARRRRRRRRRAHSLPPCPPAGASLSLRFNLPRRRPRPGPRRGTRVMSPSTVPYSYHRRQGPPFTAAGRLRRDSPET
jgi:hypothetical protein